MGRPLESDWPQDVSLPWNSFKAFPPKPVDTYIPEIDPVAKDLFEVGFVSFLDFESYNNMLILH